MSRVELPIPSDVLGPAAAGSAPVDLARTLDRARPAFALLSALLLFPGTGFAQWGGIGSDKSLFSIPRSQDDIHEVRTADQEIRAGAFEPAVERLHLLLRRGRKGLIPTGVDSYQGMRAAIIERMRELPEQGLEAYEKLMAREAGDLVRTAFVGRNFEGLQILADRFPTSIPGRRALLRLGDLWLEAGEARRALGAYRQLLAATSNRDPRRATIRQRLEVANSLATGRGLGQGAEILELADGIDTGHGWSAYCGGGDGTAAMVLPQRLGEDVHEFQIPIPGYSNIQPLILHATGGLGGLYFNTGQKVVAFDPIGGRVSWQAPGPMVGSQDEIEYFDTMSPYMLLSATVSSDVVVGALLVPNNDERRSLSNLQLMYKLPSRRLFAFDRHTGKRLWAHWDYEDGPRTKMFVSHNAPAPPIIDGDTLYATTNDPTGAISYYVTAYELRTGEPKWQTLICSSQGEVNMFGNANIEYAATPLALHEGMLYGTTNLGLCYAVDADSGRVQWCTSYPIISMPPTRLRGQNVRQVFFGNNPVIVSHGVMVCTPLDSEHVLALDTQTGLIRWKLHWSKQAQHQNNLKWLLGVVGDEVVLSGAGVISARLRPSGSSPEVRQIRNPQYFGGMSSDIARGAICGEWIVHPTSEGMSVFDQGGKPLGRNFALKNPGNVLLMDGMIVSVRGGQVQVHLDQEGLMEEAQTAIRKQPDEPANYLRLAMLMRGGKNAAALTGIRGERTVKLLRQGIAAARRAGLDEDSPVLTNLANELFRISMLRAEGEAGQGAVSAALALLVHARDESRIPDNWIAAQLEILELVKSDGKRVVAELDLLARKHGAAWYRFPVVGRMPVRPYTLWRRVALLRDPKAVVAACQDLLENYADIRFEQDTGRELAVRRIGELIAEHGREVYAAVETRARQQLEAAGRDVVLLRGVDGRFPHSLAAGEARRMVLDQAVLSGDLATAAAMTHRSATAPGSGMLRRLMVAAAKAGNLPLAHALGIRLRQDHGDEVSDFSPDGGRALREVVTLPELPAPAPVLPGLPVQQLDPPITMRGSHLEVLETRIPAGYPTPQSRLLYVAAGVRQLAAYDVAANRAEPVFMIPARLQLHVLNVDERLYLCGDRLIVNEGSAVRAVHCRTGAELWTHASETQRSLDVLAVQNGIVHLFSTLSDQGDGGQLIGLDALSGAPLFTHVFPAQASTVRPRAFVGDLWMLRSADGSGQVEVHRIDGITGRLRHRFPIPPSVQAALGMRPDRAGNVRLNIAQNGLLVDGERAYICAGDARSNPVVTAFDHAGQPQWTWKSPTERASLKLESLHRTGIVLLEVTTGHTQASRLVILDKKSGAELRGTRLRGSARPISMDDEPHAPDTLLLELGDGDTSLICYSLNGDGTSFRYNANTVVVFYRHPVIGDGFLAAPMLDSQGVHGQLLVLDLKTRQGALPDGSKTRPLPDRGAGYKVAHHDQYILCQTQNGILVFGREGSK